MDIIEELDVKEASEWGRLLHEGMKKSLFLVPLQDGRVVIAIGTTGVFDPASDVFEDAGAAGAAAAARIIGRQGQEIPGRLVKSRV